MKRGATRHPKLMALAQELGVCRHQAVGILEDLWHWTAKYAPSGSLSACSDQILAEGIGHVGDPHRLVEALVKTRWVDPHPMHRLVVHDWWDHAEDSVNSDLARKGKLFCNGKPPKTGRLAGEERVKAQELLALAVARYPEEASQTSLLRDSAESPPKLRGDSAEKSALPLPLPLPTAQHQPLPTLPNQKPLAGLIGLAPERPPEGPRPVASMDIVLALRQHITLIAELDGHEWDETCRFVTSGALNGKKLKATLSLERMTPEGARHALADARKLLNGMVRSGDVTQEQIREAEERIKAREVRA